MRYRRRSIRLKNYNYTKSGMYFITLLAKNDLCIFGEIKNNMLFPNNYGEIVIKSWLWIENQYSYIQLDSWVLMPDHFHGIIVINHENCTNRCKGGSRTALTEENYIPKSLGRIIGAFKTVSTKQINKIWNTPGTKIWHRNYYEHIIRNKNEYYAIRQYIINNPKNWKK